MSFNHLKLLCFTILLIFGSEVMAQSQKISGVIADESGEPLPGVTVRILGSTLGTISDVEGKYAISSEQVEKLVFSFIGFKSEVIEVSNRTNIDVTLEYDISELDEVVVVGYGTSTKRDITGAVSQVKGDDFEQRTVGSVQESLAGIIPGVSVSSNGGSPGAAANILVRGISTISTNNNPIYVVDGTPLDDIEFLNPKDIATVQVLKDASAASIYGSRGSNGVIIITTKTAEENKTSVNISARHGLQSVARRPEMANATEYAEIRNRAAEFEGRTPVYDNPAALGKGTDWWDELTQVAPMTDLMISASKGSKDLRIASSLSYFSQDGIVKGADYERIAFRLNSDYDLSNWFNLGLSLNVTNSSYQNGPDLPWDLQRLEPVTPIYLPEFERGDRNEFSIFSPTITDVPNAMGVLARNFSTTDYTRLVGNLRANIQIAEPLSLSLSYGFYNSNWENNNFSPTYFIEPNDQSDLNSVFREHNNRYRHVSNNILTFDKKVGQHSLKIMGGMTYETESHHTLSGNGTNLPSNHPDLRYINAAVQGFLAGGTDENWSLLSYLGRINYSFKDRYFITSNFRADGSSKFPTENQWAFFPSLSAGWLISEESFLEGAGWLELLKIRGAWGQIGNQNIPLDARQSNIQNVYYISGPDQSLQVGAAPGSIGNDQLLWETIEDINIGFEMIMFKGRLDLSFDAYQRNIKDMLLTKPLPAYLGLGFDEQWANVGTMETKGFEFQINYRNVVSKDFSYKLGLTGTNSRSTMTQLNGQDDVYWDGNDQRLNLLGYTAEGGTPSAFYGWVTDGIFQTQSEVNNYTDNFGNRIQPLAEAGDFRFQDLNGDGTIDDQDRKVIGNPEAFLNYGFNFNLAYKAFTLSGLFTGKIGGDILTPIKAYTHSGSGGYNSYAGLLEDSWNSEGSTNLQPRILNNDRNQNFRYSDYYIQDGSYLRLKNIQLAFQLPSPVLEKLKLTTASVYITAENLATITGYDGMDPDIGGYATLRGVDWGNYPLPRIVSTGINVSF